MTDGTFPGAGADGPGPAGAPSSGEEVNWLLVLGLAALAGLWPVAELSGLRDLIDPARTALLVFTLITVIWISWVGFFQVPRPVLTLTLTGAVSGVVLILLHPVPGLGPAVDGGLDLFLAVVRSTALGVLAGLLGWALQQARGARR